MRNGQRLYQKTSAIMIVYVTTKLDHVLNTFQTVAENLSDSLKRQRNLKI